MITLANSLDPDQAQQYVGPDQDPNFLTLWIQTIGHSDGISERIIRKS